MSRISRRLALVVPTVFALLSLVLAARAAAGPCLPSDFGC